MSDISHQMLVEVLLECRLLLFRLLLLLLGIGTGLIGVHGGVQLRY